MVFIDFFLREPPRSSAIGSRESNLSSCWMEICWDGGRTSKNSWMESLVIVNSFVSLSSWCDPLPFHDGDSKEFPYDFSLDISTWIQKLCPSSLLEHFRYGSVFKGLHSYNPFHDDRCPFVAVVVGHVYLNGLKILWVCALTLWGFLGGRVLSRRHLQKQTQSTREQEQKHKTRT